MLKFSKRVFNIPKEFILPVAIVGGIIGGLVAYTAYMARIHSYLSDDPSACVNCHIMTPYYETWRHSSHALWTNCNDCHVPQDNVLKKYAFKAKDGLYHSAIFTLRMEPMAVRPRNESYEVIMDNCIRCHDHLNSMCIKGSAISYADVMKGDGKACWDCHRQVPHGGISNINSSPNAPLTPLPKSPIPKWLKEAMK
ncbi:MAG: cytochrome c nitrite reductase small subunit [Paludibacter sp.]|nr:cytochrome c nitrite reductase small subunit [Paludibacter sp.]